MFYFIAQAIADSVKNCFELQQIFLRESIRFFFLQYKPDSILNVQIGGKIRIFHNHLEKKQGHKSEKKKSVHCAHAKKDMYWYQCRVCVCDMNGKSMNIKLIFDAQSQQFNNCLT